MSWLDYLLVGLIAAYCLYILLRPKKGGCGGDCARCHKKCEDPNPDRP